MKCNDMNTYVSKEKVTHTASMLDGSDWPAFTDEKRSTMIFDNECIVGDNHDRKILEIVGGN